VAGGISATAGWTEQSANPLFLTQRSVITQHLSRPWSRQTTGASFIRNVIDLVSATLPRATLSSTVKTGMASPFKLSLTMQIASEEPMRTLVSIIAFSLIVAVAAPAFAGAPKTEAACKKAGMQWDATAKKCSKGM
jgi:hypothetical protein